MKKRLVATLILLLTWSAMNITTAPEATARGRGPCSETKYEVNRTMSAEVRIRKMKGLIRCAFDFAGIPEETDTAIAVATRESGLRPWAKNPDVSGSCHPWSDNAWGSCGVYQHLSRLWPPRVASYLRERWFPGTWPHVPILQARANVLVTALVVRGGGWCAWTAPNYCG